MKRLGVLLASSALLLFAAAGAQAADSAAAAPPSAPAKAKPAAAKSGKVKKKPDGPCYSKAEFDAEQGIRFHTELMVMSLTCQDMAASGQNLFADYKRVTLNLRDPLLEWEKALIGYYRKVGTRNPTRSFDNFRTSVANEASQRIAAVTTPIYCEASVPMIARALKMSVADARGEVDDGRTVRIGSAPRCDLPRPTVAEAHPGDRQLASR
jgi:hypothetical protein